MISKARLTDNQKLFMETANLTLTGVGGSARVAGRLMIDVVIDNQLKLKRVECLVVEEDIPTLIGLDCIEHECVKSVTFNRDRTVAFSLSSGQVIKVKRVDCNQPERSVSYHAVPNTFKCLKDKVTWINDTLGVHLGGDGGTEQEQMANLLVDFNDVFGTESNMGCHPRPVRIKTEGPPISARQYPIPQQYQGMVDNEIRSMLKMDVIEAIDDCQGW